MSKKSFGEKIEGLGGGPAIIAGTFVILVLFGFLAWGIIWGFPEEIDSQVRVWRIELTGPQ